MLDDSLRLQENPHLLALFSHYAQMGTEDRATWQDRLMQMEGVEPKQLSALHGDLIIFDWIEQNTGQAIMLSDGRLSACYRITPHGLREHYHIQGMEYQEKPKEAPEKPASRFPRKKKQKADSSETPVVSSEPTPVAEASETPVLVASEPTPVAVAA